MGEQFAEEGCYLTLAIKLGNTFKQVAMVWLGSLGRESNTLKEGRRRTLGMSQQCQSVQSETLVLASHVARDTGYYKLVPKSEIC